MSIGTSVRPHARWVYRAGKPQLDPSRQTTPLGPWRVHPGGPSRHGLASFGVGRGRVPSVCCAETPPATPVPGILGAQFTPPPPGDWADHMLRQRDIGLVADSPAGARPCAQDSSAVVPRVSKAITDISTAGLLSSGAIRGPGSPLKAVESGVAEGRHTSVGAGDHTDSGCTRKSAKIEATACVSRICPGANRGADSNHIEREKRRHLRCRPGLRRSRPGLVWHSPNLARNGR